MNAQQTDSKLAAVAGAAAEEEPQVEQQEEEETPKLNKAFIRAQQRLYDMLMEQFPTTAGKAVSKKERDETHRHHSTLTYGEISFASFALVMERITKYYGRPGKFHSGEAGVLQHPGGKFYDIGSGTGKPVFAAALMHPFDYCCGIEILEGLHNMSLEILHKFDTEIRELLTYDRQSQIEFVHGDAMDFVVKDWRDADLVFANSTCFDDALMDRLAAQAVHLRKGAFVVTFTRSLQRDEFEVLEGETMQMSWGGATVYIHQKRTDPPAVDS